MKIEVIKTTSKSVFDAIFILKPKVSQAQVFAMLAKQILVLTAVLNSMHAQINYNSSNLPHRAANYTLTPTSLQANAKSTNT